MAAQDDPRLAQAMALNILGRPGFAHGPAHRFSQTLVNNDVSENVLTDLDLEVIEAAPRDHRVCNFGYSGSVQPRRRSSPPGRAAQVCFTRYDDGANNDRD